MPEIKFNTKIYKKKAIQEAVSAYSHLANFTLKETAGFIKVKIEKIDRVNSGIKNIIADEFANYVLGWNKR